MRPVPPRRTDHPRIRGEHVAYVLKDGQSQGSSPHTRGALHISSYSDRVPRIIPAYAGSTSTTVTAEASRGDHPRIRGEHG